VREIVAGQPSRVHLVAGPTISAVAFCPHPPLLLPEIAAGTAIETQSLRSACVDAVDRLVSLAPGGLLVIGADGPLVTVRDFAPGIPDTSEGRRPLSHLIAEWLLRGRANNPTYVAIGADARPKSTWPKSTWPNTTGPIALLVMGDGSARRSLKAPGYLDERAQPFDEAVVTALAAGSVDGLADLDLALAAELLAAGAPAWVAAADLIGSERRWRGDVLYTDAPYGVMYTVAFWSPA
jgi:hypothetical protein